MKRTSETADALLASGHSTQSREPQNAVAEVGQAALLGLPVDDLLQLAVDIVLDVLDVDYAKILHEPAPGDPLVLVAGRGWGPEVEFGQTTVPNRVNSQAGYTLMVDGPIIVEDLADDGRFEGPALLIDHGVISGVSVVIPGPDGPYGVLGAHTRSRRLFTRGEADFLRSVANIIGGAVHNDAVRSELLTHIETGERRVRYQEALAECARALLTGEGTDRIELAAKALLVATTASFVFIERNVTHPEKGFCSETIVEVEQPGIQVDPEVRAREYWDLVPWERMPTSRHHLERGEPFIVIPEQLEGVEYDQYAADPYPVRSELDIPIFIEGQWEGLIGFADTTRRLEWSDEELLLLTTAASMIGAFWEREASRSALEELIRSKDAFLATVSHELRTPLTAVVGFGQMLREDTKFGLSEAERDEVLELMVKHGLDLTNIVSDLLVAAKADIGTLAVTSVPVNLRAQAAQVLESFDLRRQADLELTGDSVRAMGDPERVRQIIRNLVSNAIHYGGKSIGALVVDNGSTGSILITDDGPPIAPEDQERIFERYQRARNAPTSAGSLGMGLTISRQLARLMEGDLTYRHENGRSVFELELPKAEATASAD